LDLVGAVGIELKAALKTRKLLILLNEKNAKNIQFAQVRYTAGTRNDSREAVSRQACLSRRLFLPKPPHKPL
jgi:hypothetical protein